jgi:hypothetical protein
MEFMVGNELQAMYKKLFKAESNVTGLESCCERIFGHE